jgi:hypothetical protein
VAKDPEVNPAPLQMSALQSGRRQAGFGGDEYDAEAGAVSHWNA